jgi:predicted RNA methylase
MYPDKSPVSTRQQITYREKVIDPRQDLIELARLISTRRWQADGQCPLSSTAFSILKEITKGEDPLGCALAGINSTLEKRSLGAFFTPPNIVRSMVEWASDRVADIARVVDPGAGSGRFIIEAAKAFPEAKLVAIEIDQTSAEVLWANATSLGFSDRLQVYTEDYLSISLPQIAGRTLFIGNPPYIRHHAIRPAAKKWFVDTARELGLKASSLAGLHIYFFIKTLTLGREGDIGAFITAAEWLDANYGSVLRSLLSKELRALSLYVLDPRIAAFEEALTTAAITCFALGDRSKTLEVQTVRSRESLNHLGEGQAVSWDVLSKASRWSPIIRSEPHLPKEWITLGEVFRVHRGQATGANSVWIAGEKANQIPARFLVPTVTKARELFLAAGVLRSTTYLKRVIDLPNQLDQLPEDERGAVEKFLQWALSVEADKRYVALHRKPWWSVGLKAPAPIICSYMARRPPVFVRNLCQARILNIAHGLYPRENLSDKVLAAVAEWLGKNVRLSQGRVYAGGLTKFEPKEVERIPVPTLEALQVQENITSL